jgi:hypothetical protein
MTDKELIRQALETLNKTIKELEAINDSKKMMIETAFALSERLSFLEATPKDLKNRFGPQRLLACRLGVSQQLISHWYRSGKFPEKHHEKLMQMWTIL